MKGPLAPGEAQVSWLFPQRIENRQPASDLALLDRLVVASDGVARAVFPLESLGVVLRTRRLLDCELLDKVGVFVLGGACI
jgi:hypothetical protein